MIVLKVSTIRPRWLRRTAIAFGTPVLIACALVLWPVPALVWVVGSLVDIAKGARKFWSAPDV